MPESTDRPDDVQPESQEDTRDGAETPDADTEPGRRQVSWRAQAVVAVLLAALGFAAVTQVRSNEADDTYAGRREQDLIDLLTALAGASERSQSDITRLQEAKRDLQDNTSKREAAIEQTQKELDTLSILAGWVPVSGPGVRITIDDPNGAVSVDLMVDTIQELRTGGAEAISFNDQVRVVAQTSFEDGVGGIMIDGQLVTPPYVIDVIGEPHGIEGAMTFPLGPIDDVEEVGGVVEMSTFEKLDITAVREPTPPEFAQPDDQPDGQ